MIDDITVTFFESFKEKRPVDPIFIEGLPGIGQVGKLVAEYMIHILGAEKIGEIHSIYFPPQVIIDGEGNARLPRNEIWYYEAGDKHILFLVGDYQSTSNEGHYLLADQYVEIAADLKVKRIYTLGGFGVGHLVAEPRVVGAVNRPGLQEELAPTGVIFDRDQQGSGIVGAAGLILGFASMRGIDAVCLMGETSGYLVDPISAMSVLSILSSIIGVPVDSTQLNERAAEMEEALEGLVQENKGEEELTYIG